MIGDAPSSTGACPFWSILIPTCEPEPAYLAAAIASVRAAGLPARAYELVVVDDASQSAAAQAALTAVETAGVAVRRMSERAGLAGNWNRCVEMARGEWVHILHQDDRVRPGFYAALRAGIDAIPQLGAAFCQIEFTDAAGRTTRRGDEPQQRAGVLNDWIESIVVSLTIQCPGIVVRRAVYERLGLFDTTYVYAADVEMWSRIAAEYPLWFDPRPLAEFRQHAQSTSTRLHRAAARWQERRRALHSALARLPAPVRDVARDSWRHYTVRLLLSEARRAWQDGDWRQLAGLAAGLARSAALSDIAMVLRRKWPQRITGRVPERPEAAGTPRWPRILVISEHFPADPGRASYGGEQRLLRYLEALSECAVTDAVSIWPDGRAVGPVERLQRQEELRRRWSLTGQLHFIAGDSDGRLRLKDLHWVLRGAIGFSYGPPTLRTCRAPQGRRLRRLLVELQPDLVIAHGHGAMAALIRAARRLPPVIMDFPDLEQIRTQRGIAREGGTGRTWRARLRAWLARHADRMAARRADMSMVCSMHDRSVLAKTVPAAAIAVLPNTARPPGLPQPLQSDPVALFIGIGHYPPNTQAIRWLVDDVWPRVRAQHSLARLLIAGENTQDVARSDEALGIEVCGYVGNVMHVYARSRVALAPIHSGSGTRIKIVEAALLRRPVVSTTIGAEGLSFRPDDEILIADTAEAFARHIVRLLRDDNACEAIAAAGLARALSDYSFDSVRQPLLAAVATLLGQAGNAGPGLAGRA